MPLPPPHIIPPQGLPKMLWVSTQFALSNYPPLPAPLWIPLSTPPPTRAAADCPKYPAYRQGRCGLAQVINYFSLPAPLRIARSWSQLQRLMIMSTIFRRLIGGGGLDKPPCGWPNCAACGPRWGNTCGISKNVGGLQPQSRVQPESRVPTAVAGSRMPGWPASTLPPRGLRPN